MLKFIPLSLFLLVAAFTVQSQQPITLYLTPSIAEQLLKDNGAYIKDYLQKETGLTFELKVPKSYDELIEDFGSQQKCFAFMSSQSYILANVKYKAIVKLRTVRFGHSVYHGMIVTHQSSGIKKLEDLEGKSIAYTDELSTSGYLYPKKMLEQKKIKPSKQVFLKKHDEVIKQVYEKKVDAGAAFFSEASGSGEIRDARSRLKDKFPDIEKKVVILVKTDPIPNDPVVFSHDFDAAQMNKICMTLIKMSQEQKGKEVLLALYGTEGFVKASDADYKSLRQVMDSSK
jgi:phosphonate transport system substrate-binding protein